jgi:PKD repeat protein
MKINEFEKMWNVFNDIPINDNDEIEQEFYYWEKGTDRFAVWHWFDEELPNGIAKWVVV